LRDEEAQAMKLDVRIPLGMLFTLMGTILAAFGIATRTNVDFYAKSLGINVNLWWGLALLVFGVTMLLLGRSAQMGMEKAGNKGTREKGTEGTRERKNKGARE
jgi:hypothetical protein